MKINELMCGDLVLKDDKPIRIYGIMERMERVYDTMTNDISLKHIAPIPLTAGILEKNGFVFDDLPFISAWEKDGVYIYENDGVHRTLGIGVNVSASMQYVHQLQHALRLCGLTELADNFQLPELPKEDKK